MAQVAIGGAGPAGATLALLLAERGIDVTLLERRADFAREFRDEVLMPGCVDALAQMAWRGSWTAFPAIRNGFVNHDLSNGRQIASGSLDPDPRVAVSLPALLNGVVELAHLNV